MTTEGELLSMSLWDAVEALRLQGITLAIASVAPFDPKAKYCEPFKHDDKYKVQVWSKADQRWGKASYGKTPEEAFRKATLEIVKPKMEAARAPADWTLHFDGGNEPVNPKGIATFGFVLKRAGVVVREGKGLAAEPGSVGSTNNVAEYTGLLKGLEAVKELVPPGDRLQIFGDSELAIKQMNGEYRVRAELIIPLNQKAQLLTHDLRISGRTITFAWKPREQNQEADRLTKAAYREAVNNPETLKKVTFVNGKYAGKTMAEAPMSYINWLIENPR